MDEDIPDSNGGKGCETATLDDLSSNDFNNLSSEQFLEILQAGTKRGINKEKTNFCEYIDTCTQNDADCMYPYKTKGCYTYQARKQLEATGHLDPIKSNKVYGPKKPEFKVLNFR